MCANRSRFLRVDVEQVAFTRNAIEALKAIIGGYSRVDTVAGSTLAKLDYDSMQDAMISAMAARGENRPHRPAPQVRPTYSPPTKRLSIGIRGSGSYF
ncbi:hypothetical protein [Croceicoccus sp. YJ47]|uniref:hypothetical protein n=1 Tax=Croceicoccus sp. YJ47 TaxID=2798724 RepID=UPI001923C31D|nr:hypothetical protein [Croceicoccus sp. YJ47]QQN74481.1 hypothetical protein JD971_01445 [Croceicoccus sp. YJ47]